MDSLRDRVVEVRTSFIQCPFSMESLRTIPVGAFGYAAGLGLDCPHPAPSSALVGLLMSVAGQTGISKRPPTCAGMLQQTTRSVNTDLEKLSSKQRTRIRSAADIPADACSVSVSLEGAIVQLMKDEAGRSEGPWREASCGTVSFQDARKELDRELAFFRKNQRRMRAALAGKAMGIAQGSCRPARETQRHSLADPLWESRPVVPHAAEIGPVRPDMVRHDGRERRRRE